MTAKRFVGKSVLVTGAASGIGRATAERLGAEGGDLVLADLDLDGARSVAEALAARHGIKAVAIRFDAEKAEDCRALVDQSIAALGKLDVLLNIAGIWQNGDSAEFPDAAWERMIRINLSSVFYITKHALPHLEKSKGNIVNMASVAGSRGARRSLAYSASKAGIIGFTKSLAMEYAGLGVRVNAICPAAILTPLTLETSKFASQTFGEPEDVAAAIAYLASNDARFVTGSIVELDGSTLPKLDDNKPSA